MKNFTLLFIMCLLVMSSIAQEQKSDRDTTKYFTHAFLGFTYQQQLFDNLNARLMLYFPRSIPGRTIGLTYGAKTRSGALAVQGEMGGSIGFNGKQKEGSTAVVMLGGNFDLGVFLTRPGAVNIYPFVGIAGDAAMINASVSARNISFDSLLSNPTTRVRSEPVNFSAFYLSWRGGLAVDFGSEDNRDQTGGIGLRLSYKQSFNTPQWNFNNRAGFAGSPSDQLRQWSFSLLVNGPVHYAGKGSGRK